MINILAVDTVSSKTSVGCLYQDALYGVSQDAKKHSDQVGDCLRLLQKKVDFAWSDFDVIVVNVGPGGFTGLRVGIATCQGLALPFSTPLLPLSYLNGLAYRLHYQSLGPLINGCMLDAFWREAFKASYYAVAVDARMQEVYFGRYHGQASGLVSVVDQDALCSIESFEQRAVAGDVLTGNAWSLLTSIEYTQEEMPLTWSEAVVIAVYRQSLQGALPLIEASKLQANYLRSQVV